MVVQNLQAAVLEHDSGVWNLTKNNFLDISKLPPICYIFLDKPSSLESDNAVAEILRSFNIPDFLNTRTCIDLNGYFGCRGKYKQEHDKEEHDKEEHDKEEHDKEKYNREHDKKKHSLESYSTWFRCLVKLLLEGSDITRVGKGKDYIWYEMGFFTHWDHSGHCRILCIDTPENLPSDLQKALKGSPFKRSNPFAMHIPLLDQIVRLYDDSVWLVRHPVRDIEKNRGKTTPDFSNMHEISRHAIHVSEVLSVTIETLQKMEEQQKAVHKDLSPPLEKTDREQAQQYMSFQIQMVKSLSLRSNSNLERLKGEVALAYNVIAQKDSGVMRSLGILTMTFLPATFITAFFSTTFFQFNDNGWKASDKIWVYWVVTIPSTLLVLLIWRRWSRVSSLNPFTSESRNKRHSEKSKEVSAVV